MAAVAGKIFVSRGCRVIANSRVSVWLVPASTTCAPVVGWSGILIFVLIHNVTTGMFVWRVVVGRL